MAKYDEAYDRAMKAALTEHLEEGVPEVDLWGAVHARLGAKEGVAEGDVSRAERLEPAAGAARGGWLGGVRRVFVPYAWGAVGLVVLMVVMVVGISGLAGRGVVEQEFPGGTDKGPAPSMTPGGTSALSSDNEYLFTVQGPGGAVRHSYGGGIGVAEDGSFWLGRGDGVLEHYSSDGRQLGSLDLSPEILIESDVEVRDANLWVLYGSYGERVRVMKTDGTVLDEIVPYMPLPEDYFTAKFVDEVMLQEGGDGRIYLKRAGPSYYEVENLTSGADGTPTPAPLDGYPGGKVLYKAGNAPNEIVVGEKVIVMEGLGGTVLRWSILKELPDGSFYVVAQIETGDAPVLSPKVSNSGRFVYVLQYSADGKLIERARASSAPFHTWAWQIAMGSDGSVYALSTDLQAYSPTNGQVDLVRLKFYPASEPLPPAPTAIPTPVFPTPVPTVPMPPTVDVPNPIPTDWPRDGEEELSAMARVLNAVAVGKVTGVSSDTFSMIYTVEVREWLKKPWLRPLSDESRFTLELRHSNELWQSTGPDFWEDPEAEFVLFLSNSYPPEGSLLPGFNVAENREHVFKLSGGKVVFAGLEKYEGWDAETFLEEIRHFLAIAATPLPTFTLPVPPTASPTYSGPAVTLEREGEGFRVDAHIGRVSPSWPQAWLSPSHLALSWFSEQNSESASYLLDTDGGRLQRLDYSPYYMNANSSADGRYAVVMERPEEWRGFRINLLDTQTMQTEVVLDTNENVPQWTARGVYEPPVIYGQQIAELEAQITWLDSSVFVAEVRPMPMLEPESTATMQFGGTLLLVDVARREVRRIAERGEVGPVLADGSVIIKRDWIDGPIEVLAPPFESAKEVAPAGTWSYSWHASPDGKKVAWLEMDTPPGDWSERIPTGCCGMSTDPMPVARSIAVWDGSQITKGEAVRRYPLPVAFAWSEGEQSWSEYHQPVWSADSNSLLFGGHSDSGHTGLYRLSLDGSVAKLAEQEGNKGVRIVVESNDGSVYYALATLRCHVCAELMLWRPDGTAQMLQPGGTVVTWAVDEMYKLFSVKDGGVLVRDLMSGEEHQISIPQTRLTTYEIGANWYYPWVALSPDGKWLVYTGNPPGEVRYEQKIVQVVRVQ